MEAKTYDEKYEEALEACSNDFFEAFGGDENLKLSPVNFSTRWHQMGIEFPFDDVHDFLQFFQKVVRLAFKKREEASDVAEGKKHGCE